MQVGRAGAAFTSRVFSLHIEDSVQHPVLVHACTACAPPPACAAADQPCLQPKQVNRNAVSGAIENITFLHCPQERMVNVRIPVQVRPRPAAPAPCMCSSR